MGFEKDVTDLVLGLAKEGAKATPMGGSVQKIKDVITKEMIPKVTAAHDLNQKELRRLAEANAKCRMTKDSAFSKAVQFQTIYTGSSKAHKTCRTTEAGMYTETMDAWKD